VVEDIAGAETGQRDRPRHDIVIEKVVIERRQA
jgi:hypothetical protein